MGIRWLNEAESNNYLSYRNARRIEDRDQAVANELNNLTGKENFGSKLNRALGFGELSRFANSFKWSNMNADNPFIRLLNSINTYGDAKPVKQILTGQKPSGETPSVNSEGNVSESLLNEDGAMDADYAYHAAAEADDNNVDTSVSQKVANSQNTDNQNETEKSEQEPEQKSEKTTQEMDTNVARVLDLNAKELFYLLYNGYEKKLYTSNDFAKIDDKPNNNVQVLGRNGKVYSMSSDLRYILDKCFEDPGWRQSLEAVNKNSTQVDNNNSNTSNDNLTRELRDASRAKDLGRKIAAASKNTGEDRYRLMDIKNNRVVESIRWLS